MGIPDFDAQRGNPGGDAVDGHRAYWPLLFVMFAFVVGSNAQIAPSDREAAGLAAEKAGQLHQALDHYMAALQALPDPPPVETDQRLRERIIKLASKLQPAPAVPEEARQSIIGAQAAYKLAQKSDELKIAVSELQRTLRETPWVASGYFILGELQKKLGDGQASERSFWLYLRAVPMAQNAESAQLRTNDPQGPFPALYRYAHHALLGTGDYDSGELTVNNSSIQFHDLVESKHSFVFSVSDVRSVEGMVGGPMNSRAILIERNDRKKFFLILSAPGNEELATVEKAIKDMDLQDRIVFK